MYITTNNNNNKKEKKYTENLCFSENFPITSFTQLATEKENKQNGPLLAQKKSILTACFK